MLKIENLSKSFGKKEVLKDLNLEIGDGSIFGLVGINGAGKSTLLRLISGVYRADGGQILLDGQDTYCQEEIRASIAFVSDDQYYPIGSTISSVKTLYESMYTVDPVKYEKYLDMFELSPDASILNLSKGMKRRVALLFALSITPKLLLLDEAYDGLEPLTRLRLKRALAEMIEEDGTTIIISSHNLKELEDICDTFGILDDGKIVSYGDLIQSKESVNKYQVAFRRIVSKEEFKDLDILHYEQEGRVVKLVVRGEKDTVMKTLESLEPILLDVLQVNFEELFIYELESRGDLA